MTARPTPRTDLPLERRRSCARLSPKTLSPCEEEGCAENREREKHPLPGLSPQVLRYFEAHRNSAGRLRRRLRAMRFSARFHVLRIAVSTPTIDGPGLHATTVGQTTGANRCNARRLFAQTAERAKDSVFAAAVALVEFIARPIRKAAGRQRWNARVGFTG